MTTTYHPTTVALVYNGLDKTTWIVVVSPTNGKKMSMPCGASPKTPQVICKAQEALRGFGNTILNFSSIELNEYYNAWKKFRKSQITRQ
jgi:hypothetical protein